MAEAQHDAGHQQHPLGIYIWIWVLLFVFSAGSYWTDFWEHGLFRTSMILLFMILKAGFIIAIFMHMAWERLALILAIWVPPLCLLVFIALMAIEGEYTIATRLASFSEVVFEVQPVHH